MIPYSQTTGKITLPETFILKECIRRMSDSIDKRFCFDIIAEDRPTVLTFQALSEEDRRLWMDAMDGKEPAYSQIGKQPKQEEYYLDEVGFAFVRQCIEVIESRGLNDEGLYRLVGVSSKVTKLTQMALDRRKNDKLNLDDTDEWEIKTITSALKNYFRNLPEPLMTFRLHSAFIAAAKLDNMDERIEKIHSLVHQLPEPNYSMLEILIAHLCKIAKHADKNLMTVSNLGVCFGPTLLRAEEETVAAIMDIKFRNIVLEILIEQHEKIFCSSAMNGESKTETLNCKDSQKSTATSHHSSKHADSHLEPVAPQRRAKRETVYIMDAGRPPGRSNHSSCSSHSGFSVSPRAESMYLDNSSSAQRVMVVQPSYVQRQSYHCMMTSSVQEHSNVTASSSQKSYSSSSSSSNVQQSSSRPPHSSLNVSSNQQPRNVAPQRNRGKPLVVYNPTWNDNHTSSSSSSESLNSPRSSANSSHHMLAHTSPSSLKSSSSHHQPLSHGSPPVRTSSSHHQLATHSAPSSAQHHHHSPSSQPSVKTSPSQHRRMDKSSYSPAHSPNRAGSRSADGHRGAQANVGAEKPRRSNRSLDVGHQRHGSAGSRDYFVSGSRQNSLRVRTLYACVGENDSELSFEPNQIIYNVRQSREPGWLEGCLNGRTGLIPENYVECLP